MAKLVCWTLWETGRNGELLSVLKSGVTGVQYSRNIFLDFLLRILLAINIPTALKIVAAINNLKSSPMTKDNKPTTIVTPKSFGMINRILFFMSCFFIIILKAFW